MSIFSELPGSHIRRARRRAETRAQLDRESIRTFRHALGALGAIALREKPTPRQRAQTMEIERAKTINPSVIVDLRGQLPYRAEAFESVAQDIARTVFEQHPTHVLQVSPAAAMGTSPSPSAHEQTAS